MTFDLFDADGAISDELAIDQALGRLDEMDPRMARVVECRFFGGLTEEETAGALDISESTVRREWIKARALLREMLGEAKIEQLIPAEDLTDAANKVCAKVA